MTTVPYGYRIANEKAIIHQQEADQVRMMFEEYISGGSILAAGRKAGIKKTHSSLGNMLSNEKYMGTDYYPQIIDDQTFYSAQQVRKTTAAKLGRTNNGPKTAPITKKVEYCLDQVKKQYSDPYRQAEYAYKQIQEVEHEE